MTVELKDAEVDVSARRSNAVIGDQPSGKGAGRPWGDNNVRWKFVAEATAPGATAIVSAPAVSDPPDVPMEVGALTDVKRASTGTVPTPLCRNISRSTVTVAGIPADAFGAVLMLKNRCELFEGSEYRPVLSEVSGVLPPIICTDAPAKGKPVASERTWPVRTPASTT